MLCSAAKMGMIVPCQGNGPSAFSRYKRPDRHVQAGTNAFFRFERNHMRFSHISLGALALAIATPALADPVPAVDRLPTAPRRSATRGDTGQATDANSPAADTPTDRPRRSRSTAAPPSSPTIVFAGISQTDEKPAVQGSLTLNHSSGLYIGTWASTIDGGLDGRPRRYRLRPCEIDLYRRLQQDAAERVRVRCRRCSIISIRDSRHAGDRNTDFFEPYAVDHLHDRAGQREG